MSEPHYYLIRRGDGGGEIRSDAGPELVFERFSEARRYLRDHGYALVRAHAIDDPDPPCEHWWPIKTAEQRAAAHRECYERYVPQDRRLRPCQALAQIIRLVVRDGWNLMHLLWLTQPDLFWYAYSPYFTRHPGQSTTCLTVREEAE